MKKKIILLLITILILCCKTTVVNSPETTDSSINVEPKIIEKKVETSPTKKNEENKLSLNLEKNNNSTIKLLDPYLADYSLMIINLLRDKNWESLAKITDKNIYDSYLSDENSEFIDYITFILHTGDVGISSSYSLNSIISAYYTNYYKLDEKNILEGLYLYPNDETEYFKLILVESDNGFLITRE